MDTSDKSRDGKVSHPDQRRLCKTKVSLSDWCVCAVTSPCSINFPRQGENCQSLASLVVSPRFLARLDGASLQARRRFSSAPLHDYWTCISLGQKGVLLRVAGEKFPPFCPPNLSHLGPPFYRAILPPYLSKLQTASQGGTMLRCTPRVVSSHAKAHKPALLTRPVFLL